MAEQVTQTPSTREEAEYLANKLKHALVLLINEAKPNYAQPLCNLILHFIVNAPAAIYNTQTPFLCYLQ